ncbi:hypothetical protein [Mycobacterium phage WXIN]|nr:hypothetical protein [Mycobacterium phage WXIN]
MSTADDFLAEAESRLPNAQPTNDNLVVLNALLAIAYYVKQIADRPTP